MQVRILSVLLCLSSIVHAFLPSSSLTKTPSNGLLMKNKVQGKSMISFGPLFAADVDEDTQTEKNSTMPSEEELEARNLSFTRNPRGLTGSTSDEDGKSNIWSTGDKNEKEIDRNSNPTLVLGFLGVGLIAMVYGISQLNFVSGDI
jgi:hypothetical protein